MNTMSSLLNPQLESILDCVRIAYLRHFYEVENDELTIMNPVTRHTSKLNLYSEDALPYIRRVI